MRLNVYIFGIWFVFCFSDILKGFIVNRGACWMSYMLAHKLDVCVCLWVQKWDNNNDNNTTVSILCKETERSGRGNKWAAFLKCMQKIYKPLDYMNFIRHYINVVIV